METSRLLAAADLIVNAYEKTGTLKNLQSLSTDLAAALTTASGDSSTRLKASIERLQRSLSILLKVPVPAGTEGILRDIGADFLMPISISSNVRRLTSGTFIAIPKLNDDVQILLRGVNDALGRLSRGAKSLRQLKIEPHVVPEGAFEIGVFIPDTLIKSDLEEVQEHLKKWIQALRVVSEIGTGKPSPIRFVGAESGSFDFHVVFDVEGATALLMLVGGILAMFGRSQKFRSKREELEKEGFPKSITDAIYDEEKSIQSNAIAKTAEDVVSGAHSSIGDARKNELRNAAKITIEFIADSLNAGVRVEILPPPVPAKPEELGSSGSAIEKAILLVERVETAMRKLERGEHLPPELDSTVQSDQGETSNGTPN